MAIKIGFKVILAISISIILILASLTYIVYKSAKTNQTSNNSKDIIVPSYQAISIRFDNGYVHLETSELNLTNKSATMKVLTLDGHTIASYKFNQNISDIEYHGVYSTNSTKYFVAFLDHPNNILNLKAMNTLDSNPCIIKIILDGKNSPDSIVEIKTIPTQVVSYLTVTLFNVGNNCTAAAQVESSIAVNATYLNYNYSILGSNNNIVSHAENIPELSKDNDVLINITRSLFNSKELYHFNLEYNIGYLDSHGQNISYSGYIKNFPFIPDRLIEYSSLG